MIRRKNKKAQEMSITTLALLVLAVIILVVIVLGFTKGWGYIFNKIGLLPDTFEAAVQSCSISASLELGTTYCSEFKEVRIAGKKQYVNCKYLESLAEFDKFDGVKCDTATVEKLKEEFCVNNRLKGSDEVNGVACRTFEKSCLSDGGDICEDDEVCQGEELKGFFTDVASGKICCDMDCTPRSAI